MGKFRRFLWVFIIICFIIVPVSAADYLIPGGEIIGLHLQDNTLTVAAIDETFGTAAKAAGLQVGDRLVSVNGKPVASSSDVKAALENVDGSVALCILRKGKEKQLTFSPVQTDSGRKLGVYLKKGITGVGTVTYYDPQNATFGALGHGVHDPNGALLEMEEGSIYPASILSVKKGKAGDPGQLMGAVTDTKPSGNLAKNTARGVFGKTLCPQTQALPIADRTEVKLGEATIRSTIEGNTLREYSVEIVKIYAGEKENGRNLLLKVTDPVLLEATGGIVQGMSGSPIIQDGKLIGAVTHVLVNDPTTGYGIFIENMLDAAA